MILILILILILFHAEKIFWINATKVEQTVHNIRDVFSIKHM